MVKHKLFLQWWFMFIMASIFAVIMYGLNMYQYVWDNDGSKLSFVIMALCVASVFTTGWASYKTGNLLNQIPPNINQEDVDKIALYEDSGWFISDMCLSMGLLGTLWGLLMVLGGSLGSVDPANPESVRSVLTDMSYGTSTAILTSVVGLICGNILKIMLFVLNHSTKLLPRKLKEQNYHCSRKKD